MGYIRGSTNKRNIHVRKGGKNLQNYSALLASHFSINLRMIPLCLMEVYCFSTVATSFTVIE